MLEAVLLIVGLPAAAIFSWSMSHRPDWWRVSTELHGFSLFAGVIVLFFAFNWFAFTYVRAHALLYIFSFAAFSWFSFRIHEEFDSVLTGDGEETGAPRSLVSAAMTRVRRSYSSLSEKATVADPRLIIDPQRRATARGENRQAAEVIRSEGLSVDAGLLASMPRHHRQRRHPRQPEPRTH
jgi:hypothetical protein